MEKGVFVYSNQYSNDPQAQKSFLVPFCNSMISKYANHDTLVCAHTVYIHASFLTN